MSLHIGRSGGCVWTLVRGAFDDALVEDFTAHLRSLTHELAPGEVVLDLLFDVPMPTPVQRKRIVDALQSAGPLEHVGAHALASNSAIGRGLLTAINWVVRPSFPEEVFRDPATAIDWLAERTPGLERRVVVGSIEEAVPGFRTMRW